MTFTVRTQYTLITLFSGFETKPQDRYYKQWNKVLKIFQNIILKKNKYNSIGIDIDPPIKKLILMRPLTLAPSCPQYPGLFRQFSLLKE